MESAQAGLVSTRFNPISDVELFSRPEVPIPWIWEGFLAKGRLHMLTAYMKVGKTELLVGLYVSMRQGSPYLGCQTEKINILLLTEEYGDDIRTRMARLGHIPDGGIFIQGRESGPLVLDRSTLKEIEDHMRTNDIDLLVIDTISNFWEVENENDTTQILRAIKPLIELCVNTGAAVLYVHHDRKAEGTNGRQVRGSGALLAVVDQALHLKDGRETKRTLSTLGRFSVSSKGLDLDFVDGKYVSLGSTEKKEAAHDEKKILSVLSDTKPMSIQEIAKATGLKDKKVRSIVDACESGCIAKMPSGRRGGGFVYSLKENA